LEQMRKNTPQDAEEAELHDAEMEALLADPEAPGLDRDPSPPRISRWQVEPRGRGDIGRKHFSGTDAGATCRYRKLPGKSREGSRQTGGRRRRGLDAPLLGVESVDPHA
jgi:hypothetical protein